MNYLNQNIIENDVIKNYNSISLIHFALGCYLYINESSALANGIDFCVVDWLNSIADRLRAISQSNAQFIQYESC
jgi:hypothetical protein